MINQNLLDSLIELGEVKPLNKKYFTDRLYAIILQEAKELAFQQEKSGITDQAIVDMEDLIFDLKAELESVKNDLKDTKSELGDKWEYYEALEEFVKDPFGDESDIATKIGNMYMWAQLEDCTTLDDFLDIKKESFTEHCIALPPLGYKPDKVKLKVVKSVDRFDDL